MKLRKTLRSPVAVAFQGFAIGAALFFTANPFDGADRPQAQPAAESVLSNLRA